MMIGVQKIQWGLFMKLSQNVSAKPGGSKLVDPYVHVAKPQNPELPSKQTPFEKLNELSEQLDNVARYSTYTPSLTELRARRNEAQMRHEILVLEQQVLDEFAPALGPNSNNPVDKGRLAKERVKEATTYNIYYSDSPRRLDEFL